MPSTPTLNADFMEISETVVKATVIVPPNTFKQNLDKQYRELSQNAKISGFRPGKAPKNILDKHFGHQILAE